MKWLRAHVRVDFWLSFKRLLDEFNLAHRRKLEKTNAAAGFTCNKSLLKNLSHLGAIRVTSNCALFAGTLFFCTGEPQDLACVRLIFDTLSLQFCSLLFVVQDLDIAFHIDVTQSTQPTTLLFAFCCTRLGHCIPH